MSRPDLSAFCLVFMLINIFAAFILALPVQEKEKKRPYQFGFTIDEQQHRFEKQDENGIVMGEFGFITADGIYHVTVYATDEEGKFRILAMRSYPYESPPKTIEMIVKPKPKPAVITTTTTAKPPPKDDKKFNFYTPACSGCFLNNGAPKENGKKSTKTEIRTLSKPLSAEKVSQVTNTGTVGGKPIDFNTKKPTITTSRSTLLSSTKTPTRIPNTTPTPRIPITTTTSTTTSTPFKTKTPTIGVPLATATQTLFAQKITHNTLASQNSLNYSNKPSGNTANKTQGSSASRPGASGVNYPVGSNAAQTPTANKPNQPATFSNRNSATVTQTGVAPNTPPSSTQNAAGASSGGKPAASNKGANTPSAQKPGSTATSSKSAVSRPVSSLAGGQSSAGEPGDLYRFKYILDYNGHTETGSRNGNKEGNYFAIGDDNVERTIEYIANEFGYQPRIRWRKLDAGSPKPSENSLKDYEFVWFKKD